MWREWLGLATVFSVIFLMIYSMSATTSTAQSSSSSSSSSTTTGPTSSTQLNPPPSTQVPKLMECYGNVTLSNTYNGNQVTCEPLTSATNNSQCNSGDIAYGVQWSADWTSTVSCRVFCGTPTLDVSQCQWR